MIKKLILFKKNYKIKKNKIMLAYEKKNDKDMIKGKNK